MLHANICTTPAWTPLSSSQLAHARLCALTHTNTVGLARCKHKTYLETKQVDAGTVAYMAPECFNPDIGGMTVKADIFSLGVIMWWVRLHVCMLCVAGALGGHHAAGMGACMRCWRPRALCSS